MRFGFVSFSALFLSLSLGARADVDTTPVSGSGGGFGGRGTLYSTGNADGSYTITGITGPGVTGLIGPGQFNGNDNLLFPSSTPVLDSNGFAFTDTMGDLSFQVDIFSTANGYAAHILDSDGDPTDMPMTFTLDGGNENSQLRSAVALTSQAGTGRSFTFSFAPSAAAVTPEPASFALLGTGFLGLAGLVRRRKRA